MLAHLRLAWAETLAVGEQLGESYTSARRGMRVRGRVDRFRDRRFGSAAEASTIGASPGFTASNSAAMRALRAATEASPPRRPMLR